MKLLRGSICLEDFLKVVERNGGGIKAGNNKHYVGVMICVKDYVDDDACDCDITITSPPDENGNFGERQVLFKARSLWLHKEYKKQLDEYCKDNQVGKYDLTEEERYGGELIFE